MKVHINEVNIINKRFSCLVCFFFSPFFGFLGKQEASGGGVMVWRMSSWDSLIPVNNGLNVTAHLSFVCCDHVHLSMVIF